MRNIRIFVPVVLGLMVCSLLLGCGSATSSGGGGTSDVSIYFASMNPASITALLSTYSNGGGKQIIRNFTSMYTLEAVTLAPNRSVIIAQFSQSNKHYLGLMTTSGGSVGYDIWPDPVGSIPALNASFGINSDLTCITGDANSYFLTYASNEASVLALCPVSWESHPCLSKSSSYDAFNRFNEIWVKEVATSNPATNITNSTTFESHPAFSPIDEKKIAFICQDGSNYYVAKKDDYSSGSIVKISNDHSFVDSPLIWSEDGAFLYYIANTGASTALYKTEVSSGTETQVLASSGAGIYTDLKKLPGSSRLFYVLFPSTGTGEIWSVDPTTGATLEIYNDENHNFFDYSHYT